MKKKTKSGQQFTKEYYIQPYSRLKNYCRSYDVPLPRSREIDNRVLQMARDKKISLEALAYWAHHMCRSRWIREWVKTEAKLLGVSTRVIERLRKELRDVGLMVVVRLGTETYTSTIAHSFETVEENLAYVRELFPIMVDCYKERWLIEKQLGISERGRGLEYGFEHMGNPYRDASFILGRPYEMALYKTMPRSRGMERLKAMGLWLLLSAGQSPYKNWKSPRQISLELGFDRPKVYRLCTHLNMLGLLYYEPKKRAIGISLFPTGSWERLQPAERLRKYRPWRWFAGGAPDL